MGTQVHCNNTMSAFSALHLLRSYNHLLGPTTIETPHTYRPLLPASIRDISAVTRAPESGVSASSPYTPFQATPAAAAFITPPSLLGSFPTYPHLLPVIAAEAKTNPLLSRALSSIASPPKRPRGEKKPIPEEQKDEKYFERRKRNNQAAKKSRDARKIREDQIALRATVLEHENAVLRAQILTLREETQSLRHLLLQRKNGVEDIPHLQPLAS